MSSASPGTTRDLRPLFAPRAVAVIGASERNFVARSAQEGLRAFGFSGPIYPVNPRYETVLGAPCYPDLAALPGPVDLAVITVNAAAAVDVVRDCAAAGIPAVLVMATGFSEAGPAGAGLARELTAIAAEHGTLLCGPGTFGLVAVPGRLAAYIAPVPVTLRPGPVAVITQSGSLVNMILSLGDERRLGFTYAVSAGSEASLTLSDYLAWVLEDDATRVVAVVAEQLRDPNGFVRAAMRATALGKPIVMLKLGRSEAAQRASLAHTGALVGAPEVHEAVFRHHGVRSVRNLDELIETTALLAGARLPAGRGVAIVSVSGGDCVLATDVASRVGLEVPPFAAATVEALRSALPDGGLATNPVDAGMRPIWERGLFAAVIGSVADDPAIDLIAARLPPTIAAFRDLAGGAAGRSKPIVAFTRATQSLDPALWLAAEELGVPIVQEMEKGFTAIAHLIDHAAFMRSSARQRAPRRSRPDAPRVASLLTAGSAVLGPAASAALLLEYGIPVARQAFAKTADEAAGAAAKIAGPLAMKLISPDVLHKADVGGIRLRVEGGANVRAAFNELITVARASGARADGVLIQAMAAPGTELLLGMIGDREFGPIIVCGLGGAGVEIMRDAARRLPPLDEDEAIAMFDETVASRALGLSRGGPPGDRNAFIDALVRFSELAADIGARLEAIDLNPIIVHGAGGGATVVDARIIVRA